MGATRLSRYRKSLAHQVTYALRNPKKVPPYARRAARDAWLRLRYPRPRRVLPGRDGLRHRAQPGGGGRATTRHRAVARARADAVRLPGGARAEAASTGCWRSAAATCAPGGCSSTTWRAGNYYGIDISPDILIAAQDTLVTRGPAGQAAPPDAHGRPDLRLPARRVTSTWCTRTASSRTRRWTSSSECLAQRRPGPRARRLLRLHLRPHRGPANTRCCARTSTTAPRRWSHWPRSTACPPGSWTTGRSCRTASRRSA